MLDFKNVMCNEMDDVSLEGVGSRLYFDQNLRRSLYMLGLSLLRFKMVQRDFLWNGIGDE